MSSYYIKGTILEASKVCHIGRKFLANQSTSSSQTRLKSMSITKPKQFIWIPVNTEVSPISIYGIWYQETKKLILFYEITCFCLVFRHNDRRRVESQSFSRIPLLCYFNWGSQCCSNLYLKINFIKCYRFYYYLNKI